MTNDIIVKTAVIICAVAAVIFVIVVHKWGIDK